MRRISTPAATAAVTPPPTAAVGTIGRGVDSNRLEEALQYVVGEGRCQSHRVEVATMEEERESSIPGPHEERYPTDGADG
jgi:hypothetical protein